MRPVRLHRTHHCWYEPGVNDQITWSAISKAASGADGRTLNAVFITSYQLYKSLFLVMRVSGAMLEKIEGFPVEVD